MLLQQARWAVVETCRALRREGLVVGTAGNVSVRDGDLLAVSPSGLDYDALTPELVGVHDLGGEPVEATLAPTSELPLHVAVYAATVTGAVVHTHAVASTALGVVEPPDLSPPGLSPPDPGAPDRSGEFAGARQLPAVHYYLAMFGGPLRVVPYAPFGTPELAAQVAAALVDRSAVLLANHGAVVLGGSAGQALDRARYLEYVCEVSLRALATGLPLRALPVAELESVGRRLASYGPTARHPPGR